MDAVDRAQDWEQRQLTEALVAHGQRYASAPLCDSEGGRRCLDCGDLIDQDRLQAVPLAARCTECQSYWERARA